MLIAKQTIQENLAIIDEVTSEMREYVLTALIHKCSFVLTEYLGYIIKYNDIKPGGLKSHAIELFPTLSTPRKIKSFLGLTGYFRKFVKNYVIIALTLTGILKRELSP